MTGAISDEERRSLRATFDLFDESNTGKLRKGIPLQRAKTPPPRL